MPRGRQADRSAVIQTALRPSRARPRSSRAGTNPGRAWTSRERTMKRITCLMLLAAALPACGTPYYPGFRGDGFISPLSDFSGDMRMPDMAGSKDMVDVPDISGGAPDLGSASLRGTLVAGGSYLLGGITSDDQVVV